MFPGMNPRKMQQMMKQLGIKQEEIPAIEVIIRLEDRELIIPKPSVSKVDMMGQEPFQITGEVIERELPQAEEISPEDVKTVMEQTGASENRAKEALNRHNGDLAKTIIELSKQN